MKKILFLFLVIWAFNSNAQITFNDTIIKVNGDTIFCKITDVTKHNVFYLVPDSHISGILFIATKKVAYHSKENIANPNTIVHNRNRDEYLSAMLLRKAGGNLILGTSATVAVGLIQLWAASEPKANMKIITPVSVGLGITAFALTVYSYHQLNRAGYHLTFDLNKAGTISAGSTSDGVGLKLKMN